MLTKVLISVKTYPILSTKYSELVCTAGFKEDGTWIRIYPLPFRALDRKQQYQKWQWIELDLERNTSDSRIESYNPNPKVEIAKIVLSLALSVFAKNISPTHRFGGYFL